MRPGELVGPYRLVERLGRGGMGEVWLSEDPTGAAGGAPRRVALKLLDPRLVDEPDARARFAREVAAARRVRGTCVAGLLDADVEADAPWLASAYVAGPTLDQHVARHGPLGHSALRALGHALADALVSIHAAGVVHRDLTPRNVVLGPDGPRVVDFGIAWFADAAPITQEGSWVGTPAWLPPERLETDEVAASGDVWSWGAVMAFAARGHPAVSGSSPEVAAYRAARGELDLDGVPDWLVSFVRAAMAPDPGARPTATELEAAMSDPMLPTWRDPRTGPTAPAGRPGDEATWAAPTAGAGVGGWGAAGDTLAYPDDERRDRPTRNRARRSGRWGDRIGRAGHADGTDRAGGSRGGTRPGRRSSRADRAARGGRRRPRDVDPDGAAPRRHWLARWGTTVVIVGLAVAVGLAAELLVTIMVSAVLLVVAVGLRLARERLPDDARPIPPTWAVGLAVPAALGAGLTEVLGPAGGAAALLGLVILFVLLGGEIG